MTKDLILFKDKDLSSKDKDKDFNSKDKDKDKDCIVKDKDQDKDCILVLKESLRTRTRTNITGEFNGMLSQSRITLQGAATW